MVDISPTFLERLIDTICYTVQMYKVEGRSQAWLVDVKHAKRNAYFMRRQCPLVDRLDTPKTGIARGYMCRAAAAARAAHMKHWS